MKVLAIDVGIVNCSYCIASSSLHCLPVLQGLHDQLSNNGISLVKLDLVSLAANKKSPAASNYDNVVTFMLSHAEDFRTTDMVVIETQMTAKMKAIAAAFYTATKCLFPQATVLFQSASAKLNFADLSLYSETPAATTTYAQRKKVAVVVTKKLLSANVPLEIRQTFARAKKKDDLSDALLHALAALCIHTKPAKAKAKAKATAKAKPHAAHSTEHCGAST